MKKPQFLWAIVAIIIVSAIALNISQRFGRNSVPETPVPAKQAEEPLLGGDRDEHGCIGSAGYSWCEAKAKCLRAWEESCEAAQVEVTWPKPGSTIISPLEVFGQALGPWFFEANLPLRLVDQDGNLIASGQATALSDWMTTEMVPFSGKLEFSATATSGYLIVSKDNPSGLPENGADFQVPVIFNQ